jgi:hypothetical protein
MEQKLYNALCKFMELQIKDYVWYYYTPEQRFEWSPESIWLINPKTEEWVIELGKSGKLWWYWGLYVNFQRYFNMERPDFEKFIKIWVEDVLNRGISTTRTIINTSTNQVEDVLNRGISTTEGTCLNDVDLVEDVLNRGISTTIGGCRRSANQVEDVLNRGISTTFWRRRACGGLVEDVLNRGISTTPHRFGHHRAEVEDVLNRGKIKQ